MDDCVADCAPILTGGCRNAFSTLSELTPVPEDGSRYVAVRHMGTPSTAELLGEVANPVGRLWAMRPHARSVAAGGTAREWESRISCS